jgi:RNA polymerase sigma factor (sigma-70 family)
LRTKPKPKTPVGNPHTVEFYEGLCRKTAGRYAPYVEEDYEDIVQVLRIKVWQAIRAYNPQKAKQPIDGFVFQCVVNRCKDLLRKKKRDELYIEDVAPNANIVLAGSGGESTGDPRDAFEARYLSEDAALAESLQDSIVELGLSELAHNVAELLRDGYPRVEAIRRYTLTEGQMRSALDEIEAAVHRSWRWQWAA